MRLVNRSTRKWRDSKFKIKLLFLKANNFTGIPKIVTNISIEINWDMLLPNAQLRKISKPMGPTIFFVKKKKNPIKYLKKSQIFYEIS